jgi:Flp pilus assembly protein TadD
VEAHNGIGAALANQGKYDEAIAHFNEALRIRPDQAEARDNIERVLEIQQAGL